MKKRPINEYEKAEVMLIMLLDRAKAYVKKKMPEIEHETGAILRLCMLMMHTQEIMFRERPDMRDLYLDALEGFMIETEMTKRTHAEIRELAEGIAHLSWAQIEAISTEDKLNS